MNKLLLLVSFICLVGCEPEEQPNDVTARASGRYAVQFYVLNGDTLYTSKGINKIGVSEFYIVVDRKTPDSVRVASVYKKIGDGGSVTHLKDVGVSELNGTFQLSAPTFSPSTYESRIEENTFYERTTRGGPSVFVLPPSFSLISPTNPALEGVIISAQK